MKPWTSSLMLEIVLQIRAFVAQIGVSVYKTVWAAESARILLSASVLMNHACKMIALHEYRNYLTVGIARQDQIKKGVLFGTSSTKHRK